MTELACFSFDSYWLCFNFCFFFIILCSCCHCKFTVEIKILNSIIKKKEKKHDKVRLFGKDKVNTIKVLISKILIDSHISHDKFVLLCNII